jgi:hypothetical protein
VSPPPPPPTVSTPPSPSALSPKVSPNASPRPIDRRRSNSTHVMGEMVEPGRLIPPLPPPRRRKSSPHVGKRGPQNKAHT